MKKILLLFVVWITACTSPTTRELTPIWLFSSEKTPLPEVTAVFGGVTVIPSGQKWQTPQPVWDSETPTPHFDPVKQWLESIEVVDGCTISFDWGSIQLLWAGGEGTKAQAHGAGEKTWVEHFPSQKVEFGREKRRLPWGEGAPGRGIWNLCRTELRLYEGGQRDIFFSFDGEEYTRQTSINIKGMEPSSWSCELGNWECTIMSWGDTFWVLVGSLDADNLVRLTQAYGHLSPALWLEFSVPPSREIFLSQIVGNQVKIGPLLFDYQLRPVEGGVIIQETTAKTFRNIEPRLFCGSEEFIADCGQPLMKLYRDGTHILVNCRLEEWTCQESWTRIK